MKDRFDLLVFDWDGTLIDSIAWIVSCIQGAAAICHCAVPSADESREIIGLDLGKAIAKLFPDSTTTTRARLIENYRSLYLARILDRTDLFTGVYDMLQQLRVDKYLLAIATGKSRSGLQQALETTNTGALFDAWRCADETVSKPDPTMLLELMQELGVEKERTLMIGDSIHDLLMARNAQIVSVGVTCGAFTEKALRQHNPLLCLDRTADLADYLMHTSTH